MTKVIEIPNINGNITVYKENDYVVISNATNLDIKVNGEVLKSNTSKGYN